MVINLYVDNISGNDRCLYTNSFFRNISTANLISPACQYQRECASRNHCLPIWDNPEKEKIACPIPCFINSFAPSLPFSRQLCVKGKKYCIGQQHSADNSQNLHPTYRQNYQLFIINSKIDWNLRNLANLKNDFF